GRPRPRELGRGGTPGPGPRLSRRVKDHPHALGMLRSNTEEGSTKFERCVACRRLPVPGSRPGAELPSRDLDKPCYKTSTFLTSCQWAATGEWGVRSLLC